MKMKTYIMVALGSSLGLWRQRVPSTSICHLTPLQQNGKVVLLPELELKQKQKQKLMLKLKPRASFVRSERGRKLRVCILEIGENGQEKLLWLPGFPIAACCVSVSTGLPLLSLCSYHCKQRYRLALSIVAP